MGTPNHLAVPLRQPHQRPRSGGAAIRFSLPTGDLRAEGQAEVRPLRPAHPGRGPIRRPGGRGYRPAAWTTGRRGNPRGAGRADDPRSGAADCRGGAQPGSHGERTGREAGRRRPRSLATSVRLALEPYESLTAAPSTGRPPHRLVRLPQRWVAKSSSWDPWTDLSTSWWSKTTPRSRRWSPVIWSGKASTWRP